MIEPFRHLHGEAREIARRALSYRESFFTLRAAGAESPADRSIEYVRWINRVEVGGAVKLGLYMHPPSSQTFVARVPRAGRICASIALLPEAWEKNHDGVVFSISVRSSRNASHMRGEWTVPPQTLRGTIAWQAVELALPSFAGQDVEVCFATSLPPDASPEHAWAVWGDPEVLGRKPLGLFLRQQIESIRAHGVGGIFRRYRALDAAGGPRDRRYTLWLTRHGYSDRDARRLRAEVARFPYTPKISLITPVFNVDPAWLRSCALSVKRQIYPNWELCLCDDGSSSTATIRTLAGFEGSDRRIRITRLPANQGISAASNRALSIATGEFIGLLDHDDELTAEALYQVVQCLNEHPEADLIYSDEDKLEPDGTPSEPYFKPDWSPEYLRSVMYIGHLSVYRRSLVDAVGGFRSEFDGSQDYDLALRVTERTNQIVHIPKVLYHWRKVPSSAAASVEAKPWGHAAGMRALTDHVIRLGLAAEVVDQPGGGYRRVRFQILKEPLVTIIIPTDGRIVPTADGPKDLLLDCARSVVEKTSYTAYELLVVDNGHVSASAGSYLEGPKRRRVSFTDIPPSNLAAKINFAARHARGEHLLLLHDDVEVISSEWLEAMLEFSQQRDIGAVGAKLYYPDERFQHIGIVLGIQGGAGHVFRGHPKTHPGYFGSAWVIRNYSAVTGACLMTRRAVFDEVGGFDERFPVRFGDVDYCLRVGASGYRVVFTPFAELYHIEGATLGRPASPQEIQVLRDRWQAYIGADPFYNPNLARSSTDYDLNI